MRRRESLLVSLIVLGAGTAYTVQAESGISRVMGSINIAAGEHTGDLSTVNGSIHIGENAVVGAAHSVDGSISLERRASAAELKTVNGSVQVGEQARVSGGVHTVNGEVALANGADVAGPLGNVNGHIRVAAAHVGGGIDTVSGGIELGPDAHVDGGIHVGKDNSWHVSGSGSVPRVIVGPGSVVVGTLRFERPVQLYVSDKATIGSVEGAAAVKFSGAQPAD
jgi:DUF4097 and DUF4098 domain-containing protein YvlB